MNASFTNDSIHDAYRPKKKLYSTNIKSDLVHSKIGSTRQKLEKRN